MTDSTAPATRPDGCRTCELVARRDRGEAPPWDSIHRTDHWDVVHALDTSLDGWVVLAARRHVAALADLTDAEAAEMGPLIRDVSAALHEVTGCTKTYLAQFAEHPDHPHVHLHLVPRAVDLAPESRGPGVFSHLNDRGRPAVSEERMNHLADELRQRLGTRSA